MYNASYLMPLWGDSLIGTANIFPQTSQIKGGEFGGVLLSFFANNLYDELGIAEIRFYCLF